MKRFERVPRCLGIAFCQLSEAKPFLFASHKCVIYVPRSSFLMHVFHLRIRCVDSTLSGEEGEGQQEITLKLVQLKAVIRKTLKPSARAADEQKY